MFKVKNFIGLVCFLMSSAALSDGVQAEDINSTLPWANRAQNESAAGAREIEFYASDKAAQFQYERDSSVISIDRGRVSVGFLFNEERDNVFTGGLVVDSTPAYLPGVTFSFGGKVYAGLLGIENNDVFGVGLGLEAMYALPVKQFPLQLDASFYYAPDILSFGQSDRIFDWQVNASLKLRESIIGFVGFRFLEFDTRPGDQKLDNAVHVGVRWLMGS